MHKILTFLKNLNLSQVSGLIAATLVLTVGLLIALLTASHLSKTLKQHTEAEARQQLERLTIALAPSLLQQDRITLNITLQDWIKSSDFVAIRVFNNNQQLIAEIGTGTEAATEIMQAVTQDNVAVGLLRAQFTQAFAEQAVARYLALGIMATGFSALLAGLLIFALAERYIGYVRKLQRQLSSWQQGGELLLPKRPLLPDLQTLHSTLERVVLHEKQQQAMQVALGHFGAAPLSPVQGSLQYRDCAMLFIEIQNLKQLQESLSAEELTLAINHYYQQLLAACKLYNGRLERYAGNGAVVLFGMQQGDKNQDALHALYTAQLFLGLVQEDSKDAVALKVEFRIAVHFGAVLFAPVAHLDSNRLDLIGDTLHWAAHLASTSAKGQVLVSQTLKECVQDREIRWQAGPEVTDLYGERQASFWLEGLAHKQQQLIGRQVKQLVRMTEAAD